MSAFVIESLDGQARTPYSAMTFPAFRPLLAAGDDRVVVLGAALGGRPVGMALARLADADGAAEVLSLYVAPAERGRGLATSLLARLEATLTDRGARWAHATYVSGKPTTEALERVLAGRGWQPPSPRMLVFHATLSAFEQAPWLEKGSIGEDHRIVNWHEVGLAAREALVAEQEVAPWIPDDLSPWLHEGGCEPTTSLALLCGDDVVGWSITHLPTPRTLRFSAGWVKPAHQARGRMLRLYAEGGRRAHALGVDRLSWSVPYHHPSKVAFARRWMTPFCDRVDESRGTMKHFAPLREAPSKEVE